MGIVLLKLSSHGPDKPDVEIDFHPKRRVVVGPSDTGKSYIHGCLWYLLGGDAPDSSFPQAEGYQELRLRFLANDVEYEIRRGIHGGSAATWSRADGNGESLAFQAVERDLGELLVELSGAAGKQLLRNQSERGPVTGDDIRHWALWSQTEIPADFATSGIGYATPKRTSSFNLFLTGNDDAAIQTTKTKAEVERIKGQLTSAEAALERVKAGLPSDVKREDVAEAIERIDATLAAMTSQYEARATKLKELRREIADTAEEQALAANRRNHAHSMIGRFELLDEKYANDLSRLGASNEGAAFFEALPEVACPLCGTGTADQHGHHDHPQPKPKDYQLAIKAEAEKIQSLRRGLLVALERERGRYSEFRAEAERLGGNLDALQNREAVVINGARVEFAGDPKTLALRRSDLAAQLGIFDEIERLEAEVARLGKSKVRKRVTVTRDGGTHGRSVADRAKALLDDWGLTDIKNISLDAGECDLVINDRARLSYGAGLRSLYLASLVIALMEYAVEHEHPHLGVVVLDSPLKPYADPKRTASPDVAPSTVREGFYRWLSDWAGHGQIVVLENEDVPDSLTEKLQPIVFTKNPDFGRAGFYPYRDLPEPASDAPPETKFDEPLGDSSDQKDDDSDLLPQP